MYVPDGMKLQSLNLRLLHITFYTIQQTSEIMHNLCPNSINYSGRSFSHILKYLQTSSFPNIPICNTTYQLPYFRFIRLHLWIQRCARSLGSLIQQKLHPYQSQCFGLVQWNHCRIATKFCLLIKRGAIPIGISLCPWHP